MRAQEGRIRKTLNDKVDVLTQAIHLVGKAKGKGKTTNKDGWNAPSNPNFRDHPPCTSCKGRHKPLPLDRYPSKVADSKGNRGKPTNPRDRCQYKDPTDGVVCRGLGHTTRHHIAIAQLFGVNRGAGGGKFTTPGKSGKAKGRGTKESGDGKEEKKVGRKASEIATTCSEKVPERGPTSPRSTKVSTMTMTSGTRWSTENPGLATIRAGGRRIPRT